MNRKKRNEYMRIYNKKYRDKYPKKYWCYQTITGHKKKGYQLLFSSKELYPIAQRSIYCPLCNVKLLWRTGKGNSPHNPSLDRIDNGKILTIDSIQIICCKCNRTKSNRTMKEFVEYCKTIYEKFGIVR